MLHRFQRVGNKTVNKYSHSTNMFRVIGQSSSITHPTVTGIIQEKDQITEICVVTQFTLVVVLSTQKEVEYIILW